ncbi:MAG: PilZ domain-containing protein [Gammaproteobacteria bacterium]|nr:PilZ domain-containing protein [Gammaproteobacteria bacterium]MDH5778744.1 PilZ domain-containing protein [Gammaproteobacteria bacterium]
MKERRNFLRNPVTARVNISHGSFGSLMANTVEISDGGMSVLLDHDRKIPEGSHLQIQMLDSANPHIIFNMKVIRSEGKLMGMQFIDYELQGVRHRIDELVGEMKKAFDDRS